MKEQLSFQITDSGSIPTSPLQMQVRDMSVFCACVLNMKWHSRLPIIDWSNVVRNTYYCCFGAWFDNQWFTTAIWSDPVARNRLTMGEHTLELRRFAISPLAPKNTASWQLSIMVRLIQKRFPAITKLISYQDTEVHKGTIYKAAGWIPEYTSKGHSWSTRSRIRNKEQSLADKIRWAKYISPIKTTPIESTP